MIAPQIAGTPTTFASSTSGSTVVLDKPVGVQTGHLLVAGLRTNGSSSPTDFSSPGFTRGGYAFKPNDAAGRNTGLYLHPVLDAAAEPASYTFTKSVADARRVGVMFIVAGVDLSNPIAGNSINWDATQTPRVILNPFAVASADQMLMLYAWGVEIVSPNATAATLTPSSAIALVPSSAGTGATRSTIWVGAELIAATATSPESLTWPASSTGEAATGLVLRGLEAAVAIPADGNVTAAGDAQASISLSRAATGTLTASGASPSSTDTPRVAIGALTAAGAAAHSLEVRVAASGAVFPAGGTALQLAIARSADGYAGAGAGAVAIVAVIRSASGTASASGGAAISSELLLTAVGALEANGTASGLSSAIARAAIAELTVAGEASTVLDIMLIALGVLAAAGAGVIAREPMPAHRVLLEVPVLHTLTGQPIIHTLEDA